jgi:hypothetical protein
MKEIEGNVSLSDLYIKEIPEILNGIKIRGNFLFVRNNITSLKNCPEIVLGLFNISMNRRLKSLVGGPKQVNGIIADNCALTSLDGIPKLTIGPYGSPGPISLENNRLTSLKGLPSDAIKFLDINNNPITSLEGCPQLIKGDFTANNTLIKNMIGGPKVVNGNIELIDTKLDSIEGFPTYIGGNLLIGGTPLAKKIFPGPRASFNLVMDSKRLIREINSKCSIDGDIYEYEDDVPDRENDYIEMEPQEEW